jgi:hypothetical protein
MPTNHNASRRASARVIALALSALLVAVASLSGKPLRDTPREAKYEFVSLLPKANMKLSEPLGSGIEGNDLAELKKGEGEFAKVPFKIENGLIHLTSANLDKDKPEKVDGIALGRRFAKLHILHGTCFGGQGGPGDGNFTADDTVIGNYIVRYQDKTSVTIPIVYGKDVRDWWDHDDARAVARGHLAWRGSNAQNKEKLRLYVTAWDNPHPQKLVTTIDYETTNTVSAPFCVAMTTK